MCESGDLGAVGAVGTDRRPGVSAHEDLLAEIRADEREIAAVQARQLRRIAAFARSRPALPGERVHAGAPEFAADELAAELRLSRRAAGDRLSLALSLSEDLPGTAAALAAGDLDLPRARAVAEATSTLDPPTALAVEERVLPRAVDQTVSQLRASLSRAVLSLDPAGGQVRHERAAAERRVAVTALPDGMAELWALLPAPAATAIYTTIDRHARRPGQPPEIPTDARRADALVELVTRHALPATTPHADAATSARPAALPPPEPAAGKLPVNTLPTGLRHGAARAGLAAVGADAAPIGVRDGAARAELAAVPADSAPIGVRGGAAGAGLAAVPADVARAGRPAAVALAPLVQVTVAATTLLGVDDEPGELAGHGPIPAGLARQLAADPTGTWRRILTDPATGAVQHVSHRSYRPPRPLARFVMARDATCRFPGCRQPARRCDLDHVTPWPTGRTTATNLIVLCRQHHRLKHSGRWTVTTGSRGTVNWTAPSGRTYSTRPPPIAPSIAPSIAEPA